MNDDERLQHLLRRSVPSVTHHRPSRDLWPALVEHMGTRPGWSGFDIGVAVAIAIALIAFPEALWLIVYHL